MKRAPRLVPDNIVLKSLGVRKSISVLLAACTAGTTANAMIVLRYLGALGQVAVLALLFSFVCLAGAMMSRDIVERSQSVLGTLRSVGATRAVIAATLTAALAAIGGAGAVLGAGLGAVLGAVVGSPAPGLSVIVEFVTVICVSSVAAGAGAYSGVVLAWLR